MSTLKGNTVETTYGHTGAFSKDTHSYAPPPRIFVVSQLMHSLDKIELAKTVKTSLPSLPASRFIPSLPATAQELLHKPQTSLSLPSLVQPHFAAATASIVGGLFA